MRPAFPWRALSLLVGLILTSGIAIFSQRPPKPLGSGAPLQAFSASRARVHLDWIAAEPHPVGSQAHARVRDRLIAAFQGAGLEVQTQHAQVPFGTGLAWVENVVARLKGKERGGAVMLASHYDSVPGSFGAADDGAGVASILEVVRALQAGPALRHDVIFLVTDGEEMGLIGAQAFVLHHPWRTDVKRVLNLEARGTGGPTQMFEATEGNADLIESLAATSPHPAATSLAFEIYKRMPNITDMTVFRRAGMRGMGFAFIERPWDYHHPTDHPSNLDLGSLQQMGETALGLTRRFADGDLGPGTGRNAVYFNPLGSWFVRYPAALVPWFSLLGGTMTVVMLLRGFRNKQLSFASLTRALGALLLSLLTACVFGAFVGWTVGRLHAFWRIREAEAHTYNNWYGLAPLAVVALLVWVLPRVVRSQITQAAFPAAGAIAWALLTVALGVAANEVVQPCDRGLTT